MEGLSEGRIVHFVLSKNICRPAIIVNAWDGKLEGGMVNLQIFMDGANDLEIIERLVGTTTIPENLNFGIVLWKTSVKYSESKETSTWHWPERV